MLAALINGLPVADASYALNIQDRGLSYGDGVFETMRLHDGVVQFLASHLSRLSLGCGRLAITPPSESTLRGDLERLILDREEGVVKLIVTRGAGGRGYRSDQNLAATRIAMLYPPPANESDGLVVRWCQTRLARNVQLAGIKHLNRLEQVLAQNEWSDAGIAEGLVLDTEGELICATASNVFIVSDNVLLTPDLRFSGIRGVMREQVIGMARQDGIAVEERAMWPDDLLAATEVFVTNAVRGIRPVVALDERRWPIGAMTKRLTASLKETNTCAR